MVSKNDIEHLPNSYLRLLPDGLMTEFITFVNTLLLAGVFLTDKNEHRPAS